MPARSSLGPKEPDGTPYKFGDGSLSYGLSKMLEGGLANARAVPVGRSGSDPERLLERQVRQSTTTEGKVDAALKLANYRKENDPALREKATKLEKIAEMRKPAGAMPAGGVSPAPSATRSPAPPAPSSASPPPLSSPAPSAGAAPQPAQAEFSAPESPEPPASDGPMSVSANAASSASAPSPAFQTNPLMASYKNFLFPSGSQTNKKNSIFGVPV